MKKKTTENSLKLVKIKKDRENQQKFEKRLEEEEKSTFRAFALRADKPFKQSIRLANLLKIEKKITESSLKLLKIKK